MEDQYVNGALTMILSFIFWVGGCETTSCQEQKLGLLWYHENYWVVILYMCKTGLV